MFFDYKKTFYIFTTYDFAFAMNIYPFLGFLCHENASHWQLKNMQCHEVAPTLTTNYIYHENASHWQLKNMQWHEAFLLCQLIIYAMRTHPCDIFLWHEASLLCQLIIYVMRTHPCDIFLWHEASLLCHLLTFLYLLSYQKFFSIFS